MLDLNIPWIVYLLLLVLILLFVLLKYLFSKEDIIDYIEKSQKRSCKDEDKLTLLTKVNTKINRDYLDNSEYYNEKGYRKIYGHIKNKIPNEKININSHKINRCNHNIYIKKNKKVAFSNYIIYENENKHLF